MKQKPEGMTEQEWDELQQLRDEKTARSARSKRLEETGYSDFLDQNPKATYGDVWLAAYDKAIEYAAQILDTAADFEFVDKRERASLLAFAAAIRELKESE